MYKSFLIILLFTGLSSLAQQPIFSVGSRFPEVVITDISNAPVKELYLNKQKDHKFYILNFWGTWCSPCIPEMDTLARLQKVNEAKIQVIAISDDNDERKAKYLKNKPSDLWLATDTSYTLYNMLQLAYVGQSIIINPDKRIVALVRTDAINQSMLNKIFNGDTLMMTAGIKEPVITTKEDIFGVDSLTEHSFVIRGYKSGQRTMGRRYNDQSVFASRRVSWYNVSMNLLYREAYGIKSNRVQEICDPSIKEDEIFPVNYEDKSQMYCVDLLVKPQQKDSLYIFLRQYLNAYLPVKAKASKKEMEVYILKHKEGEDAQLKKSIAEKSSFSFSGRGYDGTKVTLKNFAEDYLTNELGLPVIDETGLLGDYDIKTNVEQRDDEGVLKSIENIGLTVEKAKREMPVIIYYK